jgi:hypothetical protein
MWQTWDRYNRIFFRCGKGTKESHRFLAARSFMGKADYQLVFRDGTYFSYEIKSESWQEVISYLHTIYGNPCKPQKEILLKKVSSNMIQQMVAMIVLIIAVIYLAFR